MKKVILVFAVLAFVLVFAACAAPVNKTDNADNTASANASQSAEATEKAEASGQSPAVASEKPADSGLTLDGIKKAAESAGFDTEAAQDFGFIDEPKPADGFSVIYKDDYSETHIPIFEFKSAGDAAAYAATVNEAGYNICVVNGKFLTMTGAEYGIPVNDNEKNLLESLLKTTVMEYAPPSPAPLLPATDYAGACAQIDVIYKALDLLVNKSVLLHDKTAPENERFDSAFVSFILISSGDLSFTATLSEDQTQLDAVKQIWEMFGVTDMAIRHDAPNDYILTGSRAGVGTSFELHCSFDPGTGALRLVDTDGGEVIELYEFVPLGGDSYAFQTLWERAIVEYKDGKITSFIYSQNWRDAEHAYDADADSIYGKKSADLNEAWVSEASADSYDQFITYDGTTIKIAADSFMGDRLNVDVKAQ